MIERYGRANCASEWGYTSGRAYVDPFNDLELDVVLVGPEQREFVVPAYWAGDQEWRLRFAAPVPGEYAFHTICSDTGNGDLHGQRGLLHVEPYCGDNALLSHGPLRVSASKRTFEQADGTPFLWLGDTWWMGFTRRLSWPADFQLLAADRVAKGFTVIQIVAGLYPDMPAFDERGYNEAGHPWEPGYASIRPAYFEAADLRIQWLVKQGLLPCIVGCWGYHLHWLGEEKLKQHWRYLVARWGAYPVVWCLAGEGSMPYYLSEDKERDRKIQEKAWSRIGRYVREIDPYHHPITIHPGNSARETVADDTILDYDMLQTGHGGMASAGNTLKWVSGEYERQPHMPVVQGEVCYEGILEGSRQEVQRVMFWISMLSGAAGFTYGANGIWQVNQTGKPYGPSPHGASWGDTPWQEAYQLPGSRQLGLCKGLLNEYPWWRMTPHQEWISEAATVEAPLGNYAAGIPGELRIIYFPKPFFPWASNAPEVLGLESGQVYRAFFFDPKSGERKEAGSAQGDAEGRWTVPHPEVMQDWVLVLERA